MEFFFEYKFKNTWKLEPFKKHNCNKFFSLINFHLFHYIIYFIFSIYIYFFIFHWLTKPSIYLFTVIWWGWKHQFPVFLGLSANFTLLFCCCRCCCSRCTKKTAFFPVFFFANRKITTKYTRTPIQKTRVVGQEKERKLLNTAYKHTINLVS